MLLNLIEHPPGDYEKIVAVVTTSEGFLGVGLVGIYGLM
jgi:hypothetical protein